MDEHSFFTGLLLGALVILIISVIVTQNGSESGGQREGCIHRAQSVDCVQVWIPLGEDKNND
jgi:hypothetical protein